MLGDFNYDSTAYRKVFVPCLTISLAAVRCVEILFERIRQIHVQSFLKLFYFGGNSILAMLGDSNNDSAVYRRVFSPCSVILIMSVQYAGGFFC